MVFIRIERLIWWTKIQQLESDLENKNIKIFPNPTSDFIAIQIGGLNNQGLCIKLFDIQGKLLRESKINKGQTISYFDIQTVYSGTYIIELSANGFSTSRKIIIEK